ncbi:MAG: ParB N-terminal domain-containing protein [Acidobacteria bacterium]|nr:ParB N-terminal domain-containing protein [Acidobacteriota bacterium]
MSQERWKIIGDPPRKVADLAQEVEEDGGTVLCSYREPIGDAWHLFALLPLDQVKPTPYQRDLSRAHVEKLKKAISKLDRFVDPLVAVRAGRGEYWTPNGNHRRAVLAKLKAKFVPVILIPDSEVAFKILALNTEKAHNLKEKSLEVIRMYRGLMEEQGSRQEINTTFEFEEAYYITLGLLYEKRPRFAGGAFSPVLRRVDGFLKQTLRKGYDVRLERAALVEEADDLLAERVAELKKRRVRHPYVKNFVMARCNPLGRARKTLPSFDTALNRLIRALEDFDTSEISYMDVSRASLA